MGKGLLKNTYNCPMNRDNRVGIDCGSEGWVGQESAMGENWDNSNRTTIKKEYIPYNLTYKWKLINKTNKQAKYNQRH